MACRRCMSRALHSAVARTLRVPCRATGNREIIVPMRRVR